MPIEASPVLFDYPNPRLNTFIMMRFRDADHHAAILSAVRSSLAHYGVNGLRADDKSYADSPLANVKSYIAACNFGVAIFEQIDDDEFKPNVSLELGYMMACNKPVLLLKEKRLKSLPTDIVGQLYHTFDCFNIEQSVSSAVRKWLRDVGIAKGPAERLVLFVSYGGTCRCAMAKVALEQTLAGRQLPYRLRIMSIAHKCGATNDASQGARLAVYDSYGIDHLEDHRVTHRNPGLAGDADLILVMQDKYREGFPSDKTFTLRDFFGLESDIKNPWSGQDPQATTSETRDKYRACLRRMRTILEKQADRILDYVDRARPAS